MNIIRIVESDAICAVYPLKNDEKKKIQFEMCKIDLAYKSLFDNIFISGFS